MDLSQAELSRYRFRLAEPRDAEAFVKWAVENRAISREDIEDSRKVNNPTCVTFVIEREDGVPILFAPVYCGLVLAYLGFNPEAPAKEDRLIALELMKRTLSAFALIHGIRELITYTTDDQRVAMWAKANDFEVEARKLYKLRIKEPEGFVPPEVI